MRFPKASFFEGKKNLFLCHAGADVDSLASAQAFFLSLKKNRSSVVGVPEHVNLSAKAMAENLGLGFELNPALEEFENVVLFDLNSPEMLGGFAEKLKAFSGKIFIIDHHAKASSWLSKKAVALVDVDAVSCTQVVYGYLEKNRAKIPSLAAKLLACGIIADSARFAVSSEKTFLDMAKLLKKSGVSYPVLFSFFEVKKDVSERIAALKAARRARVFRAFDKIISVTQVNSFEATAAMSLVFLGAHVGFAGGEKEGRILISGRALNSFASKTGFDLVKHVFVPLSQKFPGSGGGHAAAAGFNGQGFALSDALFECAKLVHGFLEKEAGKTGQLKEYE
ncbi:MAG: DHH family phosphoesterase [archaeon]|nr:DHH family phosphoesterase [archaeon]